MINILNKNMNTPHSKLFEIIYDYYFKILKKYEHKYIVK